jgi:tetratricopeptide (TPR) repeat protein
LRSYTGTQGNYAKAESLSKKVVAAEHLVLGPEHRDTLISLHNLAEVYGAEGKYTQAERLLTGVVETSRRNLGAEHPFTLFAMNGVGMLYLNQREYSKAETWLRHALNRYEKTTAETWPRYFCQSMLGASLAGQRKFAEAETPLVEGYEGMLHLESTISFGNKSKLEKVRGWVVQLYKNWGKQDKAAEWQEKLQETKGR